MRARLLTPAFAVLSLAFAVPALAAPAPRVTSHVPLAEGVELARYDDGHTVANVASVASGAAVKLRPVAASAASGLERTSAICARVEGCIAALNGDFALGEAAVGGLVIDHQLLRSPNRTHHDLMMLRDGALRAGQLRWRGRLVATDLDELRLDAVNRDRGLNDLVLYTGARGPTTRTNAYGAEMRLRLIRGTELHIGQTSVLRMLSFRRSSGDSPIAPGELVLSGHGRAANALASLWKQVGSGAIGRDLLLRAETTPPVQMAIGGTPILLRDGQVWFRDDGSAFMRARTPRTMIGWNDQGDRWLVTVDGRQPGHSRGYTLREAAEFLRSLGATEGLNLDGGGSTTFAVGSQVVNRPSDRAVTLDGVTTIVQEVARGITAPNVERPVPSALVLVAAERAEPASPPSGGSDAIMALPGPAPAGTDPASNPARDLPVAVPFSTPGSVPRSSAVGIAALLNTVVVLAHLRRRSRRITVTEPD